uniref:Nuclease HARBI1 n=1 Tax=Cucumis melo TaxID=3656 RepID=A0A9I9ED54_CUCME
MKYSSTRNVIERAFGLLKGSMDNPLRKVLLPYLSLMSHNLIDREMTNADILKDIDDGDSCNNCRCNIHYIETSKEWS